MRKVILIPCGPNRQKFLYETLKSIKCNIKILVINDSGKKLNLDQYKNLEILDNLKNIGLTASLFKWRHTYENFDIIYRLDTGSVSNFERFKVQEQMLLLEPSLGIVAARSNYFIKNDYHLSYLKTDRELNHSQIRFKLNYKNPIAHSSIAIRGKALREIGGYSKKFNRCQDYELYLRMINKNWKIKFTKEILHKHIFIRKTSNTLNNNRETRLNQINILLYHFGFIKIILNPIRLFVLIYKFLISLKL